MNDKVIKEAEKPKDEEKPKEKPKEDEKCNKLKSKKKKNVDTEEEEEEEEEEKEVEKEKEISPEDKIPEKDQLGGSGPTQNVFVPPSNIDSNRNASGGNGSPSDVSYSGKSASPELMKSPLFTELSKQLDGITKSVTDRLNAIEKSVNDRIGNVQKAMDAVEKFYKQPLYKSVDHSIGPEEIQKQGITEQIKSGNVKYSN